MPLKENRNSDPDISGAFQPPNTGGPSAVPAADGAPDNTRRARSNPSASRGNNTGGDVVAMLQRDMSYSAVAAASAARKHDSNYSSDEDSLGSLDSDIDGNGTHDATNNNGDGDNLNTSHGSGNSNNDKFNSSRNSIFSESQQSAEEAREEGIAVRRKLIVWLLGIVICLIAIAIVAVATGMSKDNKAAMEEVVLEEEEELTTTASGKSEDDLIASLEDANLQQQHNLRTSLRSLVHSLTASNPPTQWPFVTTSLMTIQGQSIRELSPSVEFIAFSPFVSTEQQVMWQNYSWFHQDWIQDGQEYIMSLNGNGHQYHHDENSTVIRVINSIAPDIYVGEHESVKNPFDYMAPLWQTFPPPGEAYKINHDMLSVGPIQELYQQLLTTTTEDDAVLVSPLTKELPYLYGFESNNEDDNDPRSILLIPVKDRLHHTKNPSTPQQQQPKIVGLLQVVINWEQMLKQILPASTAYRKGTLANDCGDEIEFYSGTKSTSKGTDGAELEEREEDNKPLILKQELLGPDIGGCSYSVQLELKPTTSSSSSEGGSSRHLSYSKGEDDNNNYENDDDDDDGDIVAILLVALIPLIIALIASAIILMSFLQLMQLIDERHDVLQRLSAKADAIVASMFPPGFRDRLYAREHDEEQVAMKNDLSGTSKQRDSSVGNHSTKRESAAKRLRSSLVNRVGGGDNNKDSNQSSMDKSSDSHTTANTNLGASDRRTKENNNKEKGENLECYPEGGQLRRMTASGSERLLTYLNTGLGAEDSTHSAPIADLFPNCTVLLADIAGFTAWSSVREPSQVFTLLETLYKKFDEIAKKRGVFKVETVGDCYVAVTGLPEPQEDHALIMVRFARDCMYKSYELTKKLEVTLGPDTAELSMRFGLHSGPVTAGVLRGDRARFQLFGDTVNTASRMESTGQKGRIQMSQETADLLILTGKSHLIRQREDTVTAKGKGEMITYWLALGADPDDIDEEGVLARPGLMRNQSGVASIIEGNEDESESGNDNCEEDQPLNDSSHDNKTVATQKTMLSIKSVPTRRRPPAVSMSGLHAFKAVREKMQSKESRLVDWNVEVLGKLLKQVIARRTALGRGGNKEEVTLERPEGQTVLEEVREIITLPNFEASAAKNQEVLEKRELNPLVKQQLHDYVSTLASMYRDNPFHNYEHASHVTMSVVKLLSRIVAPKRTEGLTSEEKIASELHDHTYGITSDPLTQFAVVMSALIHDVDHTGVPNSQLVKEDAKVAEYYKGKSVAEQNSVDMSWNLLMEPQFRDLRNAIYCDEAELTRFRSLIVNAVMATDIVDKELKQLRNNRWDKAFSGDVPVTEEEVYAAVNRKATIVLEHLIQASDVSHTMQHWHVYRKWNERLFHEMYNAYRAGRAEKDPAEFWYKGEIGFFDFYIIPLAKKLKDCGVFGVSSDEYLNYAMKNREEWARRGEAVTAEMVAKARDLAMSRMERQASARGPLIREMKAAVASMRAPKPNKDMFKQASFRHLRVAEDTTETIVPNYGFPRLPPRRKTPNRNVQMAVSIGTAERNAMRQYRQARPTPGNNPRSSDSSVASVETAPPLMSAVSMGTAERNALRQFRQSHPGGSFIKPTDTMAARTKEETAPPVDGGSTSTNKSPAPQQLDYGGPTSKKPSPTPSQLDYGAPSANPTIPPSPAPPQLDYSAPSTNTTLPKGSSNERPPNGVVGGMGMRKPVRRCSNV